MDRDTFSQCIDESDVMILHGGVGTIMQGLKSHKRIIVVPRLKQFGEHVDDHQMEAAWALKSNHCVLICMNTVFLGFLIKHAKEYEFKDYEEPKHKVEELVLEELAKESAKTKQPWSLQKSLLRFFTLGPKSQTEEIN